MSKFAKVFTFPLLRAPRVICSDAQQQLEVDVVNCSFEELEFDLVGVDAAIANAIRRVLIAEVRKVVA